MNTILCVLIDDDLEDRLIFEMVLEDLGSNIVYRSFTKIEEAFHTPNDLQKVPDFIFLDISIPPYRGTECLEKVNRINPYVESPIIIYSDSVDANIISETQRLGASHYLVKPTRITTFTAFLRAILRKDKLPYLLLN